MSDSSTLSILDTSIDVAALPDLLNRLKPILDKIKNITADEFQAILADCVAAAADGKVTVFEVIKILLSVRAAAAS